MNKSKKFSPELRERAVRMVQEHRREYPSLWTAIESIAPKIGWVPQTLLDWVKRAEVDAGVRSGISTTEARRVLAPIGYIPAAEAEANYYRQRASQATAVAA